MAETFIVANGVRYAMPSDFAVLEEDGTITLLGRGSVSINSGGERSTRGGRGHGEAPPGARDATVIGVPDDDGATARPPPSSSSDAGTALSLDDLQAHCRTSRRYKIRRQLNVVDEVVRSRSGKPDYRWARDATASRLVRLPDPHGTAHGIRIVELVGLGPVPFAGMLLADVGAEVLAVDHVGLNVAARGASHR